MRFEPVAADSSAKQPPARWTESLNRNMLAIALAKVLSDQDIADIAAYYAQQTAATPNK